MGDVFYKVELFLTLQRVFKRNASGINAGRDLTVKDVRLTHVTIKHSADGTQQHVVCERPPERGSFIEPLKGVNPSSYST